MGRLLEKTLDNIDEILEYLSRFMIGKDFASYCDLSTTVGLTDQDMAEHPDRTSPHILVSKDNAFISVYEVSGLYQILSADEYTNLIHDLQSRMSGYFNKDGHSLSIVFEKDPAHAKAELERLAAPMYETAKRIGLTTEDIISSRLTRNEPYVAREQCFLIMYTHLRVLSKNDKKQAIKNYVDRAKDAKLQKISQAQNPFAVLDELKVNHEVFVNQMVHDLLDCGAGETQGIMVSQLSAHEAIRRIRNIVSPEQASNTYKPLLPGDPFMPHGFHHEYDVSSFLPPQISYQICNNDVEVDGSLIKTGEYFHGNLCLELGPTDIKPFSTLFTSIHKSIPWRVRYDLFPDGLKKFRGRAILAQFTNMASENRSIYESLTHLEKLTREDTLVCSMKITFSTWARSKDKVVQQVNALATAISTWGQCVINTTSGDPLESWCATIPAFCLRNPANLLVPPLEDALYMMPIARPATPWNNGSMIMRTPDGKIFPIQLGSSLQNTHIESITSPPGGGKSLLLNIMNFSEIHSAGRTRLPLITIVDVGPSSEGLISLVRDSLPDERKEEAVYLQLHNDPNYAVNPFDTQLGARKPTSKEREFLVDLLTLFCTDPATKQAPADCARISEMILDIVYRTTSEASSAKKYEKGENHEIDTLLVDPIIRKCRGDSWWNERPSWYEVTDILFENGYHGLATIAQRYAVPTLDTIISTLNSPEVYALYHSARTANQEPIIDYMMRCLTAALTKYALFSSRTKFQLGSVTRVIAIDLQNVVGSKTNEGQLTTSAMYMFARQLAARNYFLSDELILPVTPELYHDYHKKRVEDVKQERKIIAYDEFHNTGGQQAFVDSIIRDGREGRKWNIRILLVSQYLQDFPDVMLSALTSIYVMKHAETDEKYLRDNLNVSESILKEYKRKANGANSDGSGSNFLAILKTRIGTVAHILTNTIGPYEAWAFTTNADDMALRNKLYKKLGTQEARRLLVHHFKTGTAEKYLEKLKQESLGDDSVSIIDKLVDILLRDYQQQQIELEGGI